MLSCLALALVTVLALLDRELSPLYMEPNVCLFSLGAFPSQAQLPLSGTSALFLPITTKEVQKGGGAGWLPAITLPFPPAHPAASGPLICPESWKLRVAMMEGVNKKELMCLVRSLGGLVPEEWLHLLRPIPHPPFTPTYSLTLI